MKLHGGVIQRTRSHGNISLFVRNLQKKKKKKTGKKNKRKNKEEEERNHFADLRVLTN